MKSIFLIFSTIDLRTAAGLFGGQRIAVGAFLAYPALGLQLSMKPNPSTTVKPISKEQYDEITNAWSAAKILNDEAGKCANQGRHCLERVLEKASDMEKKLSESLLQMVDLGAFPYYLNLSLQQTKTNKSPEILHAAAGLQKKLYEASRDAARKLFTGFQKLLSTPRDATSPLSFIGIAGDPDNQLTHVDHLLKLKGAFPCTVLFIYEDNMTSFLDRSELREGGVGGLLRAYRSDYSQSDDPAATAYVEANAGSPSWQQRGPFCALGYPTAFGHTVERSRSTRFIEDLEDLQKRQAQAEDRIKQFIEENGQVHTVMWMAEPNGNFAFDQGVLEKAEVLAVRASFDKMLTSIGKNSDNMRLFGKSLRRMEDDDFEKIFNPASQDVAGIRQALL